MPYHTIAFNNFVCYTLNIWKYKAEILSDILVRQTQWRETNGKIALYIWLFWALVGVCRIIPRNWAMYLGSAIGELLYRILKKRRQIALNNLQIAFGDDIKETRRHEICKASFINFSKTIIEFMRFPKLDAENIWREVKVHGREHLNSLWQKEKVRLFFYRILEIGNFSHSFMVRSSRIERKQSLFR